MVLVTLIIYIVNYIYQHYDLCLLEQTQQQKHKVNQDRSSFSGTHDSSNIQGIHVHLS